MINNMWGHQTNKCFYILGLWWTRVRAKSPLTCSAERLLSTMKHHIRILWDTSVISWCHRYHTDQKQTLESCNNTNPVFPGELLVSNREQTWWCHRFKSNLFTCCMFDHMTLWSYDHRYLQGRHGAELAVVCVITTWWWHLLSRSQSGGWNCTEPSLLLTVGVPCS